MWFENADSAKAKLDAVTESATCGLRVDVGGAYGRTWDELPHILLATVAPVTGTDGRPR